MTLQVNSTKHSESNTYPSQTIPKNLQRKNAPKLIWLVFSVRPASSWYQNQMKITLKKKKKKLQDNVTDEHAGKCPLKILTNIKYISCVKLEFYLVNLFKGEWLLIANFNKSLSLFHRYLKLRFIHLTNDILLKR